MKKSDSIHVTDLKIKKCNLFFVSIFWILTITVLGIFGLEFFYIQKPKSERCILPHHDLQENPPKENECKIYTSCDFRQNGTDIDGDPKYYLHSDQVLFLPKDYRVQDQIGKCPIQWELPGYKIRLDGGCDDEGFGCCEAPLDVKCNQILHYHGHDISYSGFLYNQVRDPNTHLLNIPKNDPHGSNCPTIQEIICESFHSTLFLSLVYILPPYFFICIICLILSFQSDTLNCIYQKPMYLHLQGSV
tara:strand:- start:3332 stop:4069 length:738 start_codon:yes stop_codon:yes gene_type:complete